MKNKDFNDKLKQIILLIIIIAIGFLLISEMSMFLPGMLGAITLYIVSRTYYFKLIFAKKWRKGLTALLFLIIYLIIIAIPVYFTVNLVTPKVKSLFDNKEKVISSVKNITSKLSDITGIELLSPESTQRISEKVSAYVPTLLNSTTMVLSNLGIMFFMIYFLLVSGRDIEKILHRLIPLKEKNISMLASETKMMIKANALGIPVICVIQGIFAALGYWLFGVEEWGLWAFLTGVFAFFPIVGTMVIWVPVCIMLYTQGQTGASIGLAVYSVVVTGNVDYIARLSLLRKLGNVHPIVTVLGVIVGINFFGFVGLVFGPLLISYFLILVKIYINEFSGNFSIQELESETIQEKELDHKKRVS